ncbi:hypothetical protein AKO1_012302 [Acrasis kona]|uniref:UBX domain-containing protein n=1 Tax=Acrasis kona TaxID=1008807 RepID=A0AAW2YXM7_9EUKA
MAENSESIIEFASITGAELDVARQYMEASGWQLDAAIELYFSEPPAARKETQTSDFDPFAQQQQQPHRDRLGVMEEEVRRPMDQHVSRLFGDEQDMMQPIQEEQPRGGFSSIIPSFLSESMPAFLRGRGQPQQPQHVNNQQTELTKGSDQFKKMFAAPKKLLFNGAFQDAQNEALSKEKWLLVNIQQDDVFDCHRLNRDTWNNELVSMLVELSFVFWQVDQASAEGNRFKSLYHCDDYPFIAIIDPRTGENVKHWTGFMNHVKMSDELQKFTDANSLDEHSIGGTASPTFSAPPPSITQPIPPPSSSSSSSSSSMQHEDEDEAYQRAIQESLSNIGSQQQQQHEMSEQDLIDAAIAASLQEHSQETAAEEQQATHESPSPQQEMITEKAPDVEYLDKVEEYIAKDSTDASLTTRLQLRLPSGKREVVKLLKQTPLVVVYALVRTKLSQEANTAPADVPAFTVVAVNKQLENVPDKTLIDANALGALLMISFN